MFGNGIWKWDLEMGLWKWDFGNGTSVPSKRNKGGTEVPLPKGQKKVEQKAQLFNIYLYNKRLLLR